MSKGGVEALTNLVLSCKKCNELKANSVVELVYNCEYCRGDSITMYNMNSHVLVTCEQCGIE
jgi:hypothetical protein